MNILFFSPYASWRLHALYEVALFHNLCSRGHHVEMICCDGVFKECDIFWHSTAGDRPINACEICQNSATGLVNAVNIKAKKIGDFITAQESNALSIANNIPVENLHNFVYKGYDIGSWVVSSVHSHFRVNCINLSSDKQVEVFRKYIYGGIISAYSAENILDQMQPEIVVIFNGRLAPTRVFLEIARARGIRVVCHERGICKESISIFENSSCLSLFPYEEISKKWQEIPLNQMEVNKVFDWLEDRREGKNLNWTAFSQNGEIDVVDNFLNANKFDRIWVLFTSSTDEIVSSPDLVSAFGSQYNWINRTLDFLETNKNIGLIIRCHPNSGSSKSKGANFAELEFFASLKLKSQSNVCIIMPDDKTSSYKLMEIADLGLVFVSTVALEMACYGKHVILACKSPWSYCGGIAFIENSSTYEDVLEKHSTSGRFISKNKLSYAVRFAYAYISRWQLKFPLITMPDMHNGILNAANNSDLWIGKDEYLDKFARIVLGIDPLIPHPPGNTNYDVCDFEFIAKRLPNYCI